MHLLLSWQTSSCIAKYNEKHNYITRQMWDANTPLNQPYSQLTLILPTKLSSAPVSPSTALSLWDLFTSFSSFSYLPGSHSGHCQGLTSSKSSCLGPQTFPEIWKYRLVAVAVTISRGETTPGKAVQERRLSCPCPPTGTWAPACSQGCPPSWSPQPSRAASWYSWALASHHIHRV